MSGYYNKVEKVWYGKKQDPIYNTKLGLGHLIIEVLKLTPERVTQISADNGAEMTCHEMRMRTLKIASHLVNCGFKQNDIVGVIASNSENLAPTVFACLTLGLPINTLAPIMIESDIIQMYSKTKPKAIFCDANIVQVVQSAVNKMKLNTKIFTLIEKVENYSFIEDSLSNLEFDVSSFVLPKLSNVSNSIAAIICSSGSTGSPKGVCKSHEQFINQQLNTWNGNFDDVEIFFNFSSLYWATGWIFLVTGTLSGGCRIVTSKNFSPSLFIEIVQRFRVTTTFSPPAAMAEFVNFNHPDKILISLKFLMVGGSYVSKNLSDSLKMFMPNVKKNYAVYGASEADFLSGFFTEEKEAEKVGSVGKIFANVKMKIIDDTGKLLGPNEVGEICYKTPIPFLKYFDDLEKTQEAFDSEGWILSGDLGHFDDDGFLFISGRKKEMLKYNNYQICPSELEELIDSISGVENSCVVGVLNENTGNDLIFAFVKRSNEVITQQEIQDFVNSKVIDAKKLRGGVHFVSSFPTTPTGKILKRELVKIAQKIVQ